MAQAPLVVVGASAGGVEALQALVAGLPADFGAAICVVLHLHPHSPSALPEILRRAGRLPTLNPVDGEPILPGHIYVAPPDHHLLVEGEALGVKKGPKENRMRPAVDTLFRSAAYTHGPRVIGVVLSGVLDDGTSGLWTVKRQGGVAVVQDLHDAAFDSMPRHALEQVDVDYQVSAGEMGPLLAQLVQKRTSGEPEASMNEHGMDEQVSAQERNRLGLEVGIAAQGPPSPSSVGELGPYSPFTCPDCHGAMVQIEEGGFTRFRCHTGHAYSPASLLAEQSESIEAKLYQTLRAMEESILLLERLGRQSGLQGANTGALLAQARQVQQRADLIHGLALAHRPPVEEDRPGR